MTRFDMIGKGFFILITDETFDLCEQLGDKFSDLHVLRAFTSERQARNYVKTKGLPVIVENCMNEKKKSIKEARITIDTVWSSLLDGEDYDFVNGILSLADFEQDDAFFIPFSTWGTLTKRAIKLGRWNCKAKFLDEDGNWKSCTIACSVPADADIDDIYSRELPVQAVFIDRF